MESEKWWDYFDEEPYEKVGRKIKGVFEHEMTVCLARISWAYLDWLEENSGAKIWKFFIDNELAHRPDMTNFDDWMEQAVYGTFLRREKRGEPRPPWCPPADPKDFVFI
ncbi:hypothetical protein [Roseovarius sp. MMSF_3350]|uniref:hypothetical protein n=1 Tax=Roseovarius sp. MMSF_3350 TaxID=3046706 RepID=UPI00273F8151|nr:hypothetical protein [Roseovarius sp. MMSF_3350]